MQKINIVNWHSVAENKVKIIYNNGDEVLVRKSDFDRAFGAILNAEKDAVIRDFGIK